MKKKQNKIAWVLAAAMLASVTPIMQSAQAASTPTDVVIKGRYDTSVPVKVEYQCDTTPTIQWQYSVNGTDGWTNVSGATSATYVPDKGKSLLWIRAGVTANGTTVYSDAKHMNERWNGIKVGVPTTTAGKLNADNTVSVYTYPPNIAKTDSNTKDIFTLDGDQYILLDTTQDDSSHFLIMRKRAIGNHTTSTGSQLFGDVLCWLNDKTNIATYADNVFKVNNAGLDNYAPVANGGVGGYRDEMQNPDTTYEVISDKIMNHINENAYWKQETKMWEWGNSEITYQAGLAIPSVTEYIKYYNKIGWKDFRTTADTNISKYMSFRTGNGDASGVGHGVLYYTTDWGAGTTYQNANPSTLATAIRPIFYVDKDFFLDQDIVPSMSFDSIGEDVKLAIVDNYSINDLLAAGYSQSDLEPYDNRTGALSEVTVDGIYETSLPVTFNYTYEGNANRLTYTLYSSDTVDGTYTEVSNQVGSTSYTLPVSVAGKYVKFSVATTDGIVKWTSPHLVGTPWGRDGGIHPQTIGQVLGCTDGTTWTMTDLAVKNRTTPSEYVFNADGMDFIMLDVTESNSSKFFIMSKNVVTGTPIAFTEPGQLMDNMMNFLNSKNGVQGYLPSGTYKGRTDAEDKAIDAMIPTSILNNINTNQVWKVERKMWEDSTERTVTGGLSFPAMHEIRQYSAKIGLLDNEVDWWTRTPLGPQTAGADTTLYASGTHMGAFFAGLRPNYTAYFRPVFYLDKSTFTDKVYDLSKFGVEVLSALRQVYTRDELLAAGYSEQSLQSYYDISGDLSSVEMNAIYETSLPAKVKLGYSGSNFTNIRIDWYVADSISGEYTFSGSVTGDQNNYRIPYSAGGKYIKALATCVPTGTALWTEARYVEPAWGPQAAMNQSTTTNADGLVEYSSGGVVYETYPFNPIKTRMPTTTPAKYTFTYNGVDYILLNTTESDESHYLVMVKRPVAQHAFNTGNGQTFDDLIGWLNGLNQVTSFVEGQEVVTTTSYQNNGFMNTANALPSAISSHINWKNNWKVERKMWTDTHERVYEGGIAIPAYKELERYAEKIGSYDAGAVNVWIRTPDGRRGGDGNTVLATGTAPEFAGNFYSMSVSSNNYIRPIFYLDKNFFTSVKVENIGAETAALISADVPKADMVASGLYTAEEIAALYPVEADYIRASFTNVTSGPDVVGTFSTNMGVDGSQWVFIAAVYDQNGKLLGVNYKTEEVYLDETTGIYSVDVTVPNIPAGSGNYAKGFVWDGDISSMYPNTPALQ